MKKIKILSTKTLSNDLKHLFSDLKFDLYHNDFISIQPLILNLPKHDGSWIFTSKNAVEAVFSSNQNIDNFFNKIYCVGKNTKSLLVKKGQKIAKMAQNSSNLAEFISKTAKNEKFIFCRSNIKNE
jgi:uroporphyrinogen-III synthase